MGWRASLVSAERGHGVVSRVLQRLGVPLVVFGLVALAGLSLGRVYNGPLLVQLVVGAALGSVLVSAGLRRLPGWVVAPVSVAALSAYALGAIIIAVSAGGVGGDLPTLTIDAARSVVPRLLTALIPVEAQPDTVLGPVILAWLAGFAGAELAARARRPAVALVAPTLLYVGALVLVGPNAAVVGWQPLAFAALAALGLVMGGATSTPRGRSGIGARERTTLRLRTATGSAVGLVAVLAVVAVVAPLVARAVDRAPIDPRRYLHPPRLDVLDQNPLIRISGWAANPDQLLFEVRLLRGANSPAQPAAAPAPAESTDSYDTRLRLAVLSDWDGVTWHVDADYRNAGRVLPPVPAPAGLASDGGGLDGPSDAPPPLTIEERITVAELPGRLLPAVSAPSRVDGVRVAYDQATGTLLNAAPLRPGLTYTVTSVNPSVDVDVLPASDVPSGPTVARYLAVGDTVPADLSRLAEQISTGESSPYLRALALETFIAEHYRYAADAPSGHAYPNLRFFLFDDPRVGGQQGTSEQFATAFAALGRLMGLPTRVVVGFRTPAGGGPITAGDALAWPEVLFTGIGWVAFDPLPQADTPPRPLEDEFLPKPTPPTSPPASVEPPDEPTWSAPPSRTEAAVAPGGPGVGVVAGGVGGGLLTLLALFLVLVVLLRAVRRRSRLDRGSPPQRVLGAWDEVLDTLALAGSPPPAYLAAAEVAAHAAEVAEATPGRRHTRRPRPAAPPLDDLAANVNTVGFAGATSALPGGVDEVTAYAAKAQAIEYARALRARRSWWRRLVWRVDPRPLRHSRRS